MVKMAYLEPLLPIDEIIGRMEGLEKRLSGEGGARRPAAPAQQAADERAERPDPTIEQTPDP